MPQYDVFRNPEGVGFLLDIQSDVLDALTTRIVVPLLPTSRAPKPAARLNPVLEIGGESLVMLTQFMAAVPSGLLVHHVGSAVGFRDDITRAIDMLTHGF